MTDRSVLMVLLLGGALRVFFFQGFLGIGAAHDDIFASKAYHVAQAWSYGSINIFAGGADPLELRLGIVLPTAVSFLLLGVHEFSLSLYPMVCSLLSLLLTINLGFVLFDRLTGLTAGCLLAVFPLDVLYASVLWPDTPMCMFQLLAVLLLAVGRREDTFSALGLFLCGLSVGLAYIMKVSGLLILPPIGAYLLYKRATTSSWFYLLGGVSVGLLLEGAFFWISTGDVMMRWRMFNPVKNLGVSKTELPGATDSNHLPARILWSFPSMMLVPLNRKIVYFGAFGWFLAVGTFVLIRLRDTKAYVVMGWWLLAYLGILLLPRNLSPISFAHNVKPVYLLPIVFPTVLIVARSLVLCPWGNRRKVLAGGLVVLCASSVGAIQLADYASGRNMSYNSREIARFIREHPTERPIYVDPGTKTNLAFYMAYEDHGLVDYESAILETVESGLIVVNGSMLFRKLPGYSPPALILSPPAHWIKVKDIRNPEYESGAFRLVERVLDSIAGGYAFVSSSGQWGARQDTRTLKRVFEDFARPASVYRVVSDHDSQ